MQSPPPTDLDDRIVALAIVDGWRVHVRSLQYMPVGGGGYHWHVIDTTGRSLFITIDDLDTKDWLGDDRDAVEQGLIASLDACRRLHDDAEPRVRRSTNPLRRRPASDAPRGPIRGVGLPVSAWQIAPLQPSGRSGQARLHLENADRPTHRGTSRRSATPHAPPYQ